MEELGEFTLENIADCTHGIIVFDPIDIDEDDILNEDNIRMVHWVGYWHQPDQEDFDDLERELREDDQFGLVDIADRLEYIGCSGDDLREVLSDI